MNSRKPDSGKSEVKKYDNRKLTEKKFRSDESNPKKDVKPRTYKKDAPSRSNFNKKKENSSDEKKKTVPYNRTDRTRKGSSVDSKEKESYTKDEKPGFKRGRPVNNRTADKPADETKKPIKRYTSKREEGGMRLNKYIANAGICSRRDADVLIQSGSVSVNGVTVTEMGSKVNPGDKVCYDGNVLNNEKKVYLLLNKPKDFITTSDDPQKRRTVLSLISGACKERIYPVGRLDRMTTGVLLFTNDGDLTKKLTHPKHGVNKVYHVVLDKNLTKTDMMKIIEGVELEDGIVDVDKVSYAGEAADKKEIGVEIHSGKNRIVRRLFESLGYNIVKLDRVSFAGLTKKNLKKGQWRFLTPKEVSFLNMLK